MKYLIFYALLSLSLGLAGASFPSQTPPEFQTLGQESNMPARVEDINRLIKYAPLVFHNELKAPATLHFYKSTASKRIPLQPVEVAPGAQVNLGSRSGATPLSSHFDMVIGGKSLNNRDIELAIAPLILSERGRIGALIANNQAPTTANLKTYYENSRITLHLRKTPNGRDYEVVASIQKP